MSSFEQSSTPSRQKKTNVGRQVVALGHVQGHGRAPDLGQGHRHLDPAGEGG